MIKKVTLTLMKSILCHEVKGKGEFLSINFNSTTEEETNGEEASSTDVAKCLAVYDGQHCWPETPADTVAALPCTGEFGGGGTGFVRKYCSQAGHWKATDKTFCAHKITFGKDGDNDTSNSTIFLASEPQMTNRYAQMVAQKACLCLQMIRSQPFLPKDGHEYCPSTFDGWSCWNYTRAGETAYIPCPAFIGGFDPNRFAHKICNKDGTWFKHPENNETWSNYTTCVDLEDLMIRQTITKIYISGYSISVIALMMSLAIFLHFRSLRCTRIKIHKNLFISFVVSNVLWIIWYTEVTDDVQIVLANPTECQVLHIFTQYFLVASYFWMFMEGLYLHTLLVFAFIAEEKLMRWFYLLGWGFPALLITAYAAVRSSSEDDSKDCWMEESIHTWILSAPVCASMLANLFFLVNIIRVLVTKLRSGNIHQDTKSTRKAVRATLILIPLLGLHYVVMPFRPERGAPGELLYHIVCAIVTSFQGLCVSLLFCFFNSEVITAIKKKWNQYQFLYDRRRYSCSTACAMSINGIHGITTPTCRVSPTTRVTQAKGALKETEELSCEALSQKILTPYREEPLHLNPMNTKGDSSV